MATASTSAMRGIDEEERDLKNLLDAFGSSISLSKSGRDVNLAGEIQYNVPEKGSRSSETSLSDGSHKAYSTKGVEKYKVPKPKKHAVSMGTVSNVIDRSYLKSTSRTKPTVSYSEAKPPVVKAKVSSSEGSESEDSAGRIPDLHSDYENFLFEMLGQGFQFDRVMIQEVLAQCGYDMKKSLDQLLDLTRDNLDESNNYPEGHSEKKLLENSSFCKQLQNMNVEESFPASFEDRLIQPKEVLTTLFDVSKYSAEPIKSTKRRTLYSTKPVENPPTDDVEIYDPVIPTMDYNYDEEDDSEYNVLRSAVKEYRASMKDYYEAAEDAFSKGDRSRATVLFEKGMFFCQKAREADEEAYKMIFKIGSKEVEETQGDSVPLDLQNFGAKEAITHLKCQLRSLSGIPSICHLKLILGVNDKDDSRRRRKLIIKLLEHESIKWSEDSSTGTITVRVDEIKPEGLSFAKKY